MQKALLLLLMPVLASAGLAFASPRAEAAPVAIEAPAHVQLAGYYHHWRHYRHYHHYHH